MADVRMHIAAGTFAEFRREFASKYIRREEFWHN